MSKFTKLFLILVLILCLEFFFIMFLYMNKAKASKTMYKIDNYNPNRPVVIVVDVSSNILAVFQEDILLKTYTVAGGKSSTPSPYGNWIIIDKGEWGDGFGGKWMGLNVPWGKYGIHGTLYPDSIGWNSSHGCVRMNNSDVEELYNIAKLGTKVILWGGSFGNFGPSVRAICPGNVGSDVYEVQILLKNKGYYKANPDGVYGNYMEKCIFKFQKDNKLPINNIIDKQFYKKIDAQFFD